MISRLAVESPQQAEEGKQRLLREPKHEGSWKLMAAVEKEGSINHRGDQGQRHKLFHEGKLKNLKVLSTDGQVVMC